MVEFHLPMLGFAAFSGTGKTTLLSKLIPLLREKGHRIGVIKHTHHNIDIDKPGKDSYVLRKSGADQMILASRYRTALIIEKADSTREPELQDVLDNLQTDSLDLVLVEGFKLAKINKIELHRKALGKPYLYPDDPNIIAIAVEDKGSKDYLIDSLDLNDPQQIADYIEAKLLS
ncbi:molybdopterin-guanine dinucleotide biosynthesis protein B [uncultured Cocleimonas sp.]|uniref:molybdopterin-guanine dinucleotide biosynthesis protein B n=1 Tax=uncultured Cocleimonas sp. TaxID=1051587 RepID=UPI00263147AA|nr:molybdopterin-guanine dinucleotide biosynthesis protein B [uncultured Cocleimonas sp.]